jgi:hypothetical protein
MGMGLVGRTLGSIGIGNVGAELFRLLPPFQMKFNAHDPFVDRKLAADLGVELITLEEVLRRADIVSISCPLSRETHHLVNAESLALMKPTAYLIKREDPTSTRGPDRCAHVEEVVASDNDRAFTRPSSNDVAQDQSRCHPTHHISSPGRVKPRYGFWPRAAAAAHCSSFRR